MEEARPINRICQTNLSKEEVEAFIIVYRRDKVSGKALPNRFEDWIQRECGIKNKQSAVIKNWVGWRAFLQSHLTAELIQRILLKTMIFLLIIFKTAIHRGIMFLTAVVKIAIHTLQTRNVL